MTAELIKMLPVRTQLAFIHRNGPVTTAQYALHYNLESNEALFQLKAMEFCGLVRRELATMRSGHGYQWRAI